LRLDFLNNLLAKTEMFRSRLGESDAAGRPRQQPNTKVFLQVRHMARNQRARQT
jgi:hypothetical protein